MVSILVFMLLSFPSFFRLGHFPRARSTILLVPNRYTQRRKETMPIARKRVFVPLGAGIVRHLPDIGAVRRARSAARKPWSKAAIRHSLRRIHPAVALRSATAAGGDGSAADGAARAHRAISRAADAALLHDNADDAMGLRWTIGAAAAAGCCPNGADVHAAAPAAPPDALGARQTPLRARPHPLRQLRIRRDCAR